MSHFKCSCCDYTSNQKQHIINHFNRKNICGEGIKEVIEISIEIKCEFCDKMFTTTRTLDRHKKTCKNKPKSKEKTKTDLKNFSKINQLLI